MRRKKFLLEKDVQKKSVEFARAQGWWARKFSSPANRSVPDYLFAKEVSPGVKRKFAVEFKKPGGKPTEAQMEEIVTMRAAGWDVYMLDNIEQFKSTVVAYDAGWLE